jgi:phospholipid/cholesterol/gamma-HCH transport system permease protein
MAVVDAPATRPAVQAPSEFKLRKQSKLLRSASQAWEIMTLAKAVVALVTPPLTWRGEFVDQAWSLTKRASLPTAISAFGFGYGAPGVQGSLVAELIGDPTRVAAIAAPATVCEQAVWITGMIVAGVAGTAIYADLGARKTRNELAALEVLGVDPVRQMVAPRVLALTLIALGMVVVLTVELFAILLAMLQVTGTVGGYVAAVSHSFTTIDPAAFVVKTTLSGLIVSLVCCYKGMNASGGPSGVGGRSTRRS